MIEARDSWTYNYIIINVPKIQNLFLVNDASRN